MINRFYTPSLPQYTSQFVEDKTPWEPILGFEQQKLQRGEKALEFAAETDALTKSLIPGYRTQEVAPQVTDYYKQRMNKWMQDYGETSYSMPAIRELTKINSEFRSDPKVKLIQQDREASGIYEQMRKGPAYRPETDPNIDPETGQIRQLMPDEAFTPYSTPIDFADLRQGVRERLATMKSETSSAKPEFVTMKGPNGESYDMMKETSISQINPQTLKSTKESLVQSILSGDDSVLGSRYQKAIAGDKWNEDYVRSIVEEEAKPFAQASFKDDYKQFNANPRDPNTNKKPTGAGLTFGMSARTNPNMPRVGETPDEAAGTISKINATRIAMDENTVKKEMTPEYYNAIKSNPEYILNPPTSVNINGERVDRTGKILAPLANAMDFYGSGAAKKLFSTALIKTNVYEDPEGTKDMFANYFAEKEKSVTPQSNEWQQLQDQKEDVKKTIDAAYKEAGIDESPFKNDFDYNRVINAAMVPGFLGSKDSPFKDVTELLNTPKDKMTPKQKIALRANAKKFENEQSKNMQFDKQHALGTDMSDVLSGVIGGLSVQNGKVVGNLKDKQGNYSPILMGQRMVKYDSKKGTYEEVLDDERIDLLKSGESFSINSKMDDRYSTIGAGIMPLEYSGSNKELQRYQFFIEGPEEMTEPARLLNSAYSYEHPHNNGVGNIFRVKNAESLFTKGYIDVKDQFQLQKNDARTPQDVDFIVRKNYETGLLELNAFTQYPSSDVDKKIMEKRSPSNPMGYKSYAITPVGITPDEMMINLATARATFTELRDKFIGNTSDDKLTDAQKQYKLYFDQRLDDIKLETENHIKFLYANQKK